MEDLEFQYFQDNLTAAQTRTISQQVQSAGGDWIQAARNYYKFRPYKDSQQGPEELVTGQGLEDNYHTVLEMLEKRPEDRRARDYLVITKWSNVRIGMTMISDIQFIHLNNTQFCMEIHAILPSAKDCSQE